MKNLFTFCLLLFVMLFYSVGSAQIIKANNSKKVDTTRAVKSPKKDEATIKNESANNMPQNDNVVKPLGKEEKTFTMVQTPAEFEGGNSAWIQYLQKNLKYNVAVDNGATAGKYTVIVAFGINKEGDVIDVVAQNDPGFGTKEEAIRLIKSSPKWIPATQNGRNVIFRLKQPVSFNVTE